MAARAGLGRAELDRLLRSGRLRRLVRGVYIDADVELTAVLRARAVALRVGRKQVVVDRTAAWIHGAGLVTAAVRLDPVPLDLHGRRSRLAPAPPYGPEEVLLVGGVRCTSPLRTALDLGQNFAPERALPLLDGLLRSGAITHGELIRASAGGDARRPGAAQFRELVALADPRPVEEAESVLRLRWMEASLPTPSPGARVAGVRVALALDTQRFGVSLAGQISRSDRARLAALGWRVLVLHRERVITSDPIFLIEHLEREFHQHLLQQVS
ncbi:hypothetical protein EFK50_21695 [Nocardioides marmoriginsengisoli]|uniref:DUF559 domain-containing protein n=2 Tax=Nocardioides marmoriginsengisoli TaxID=661483 RepID=A0A3N0CAK9_9ACTN|nr:hypothetical protein EFK50_21695 [Nocardioides marmoriginsengisoli]